MDKKALDAIKELQELQAYSRDTFISWKPYYNACEYAIQAIKELEKLKQEVYKNE